MSWRRTVRWVIALPLALAFWAIIVEPRRLTFPEREVQLPHLHPGLSGLRVAVLADLHVGSPANGLDRLAAIVEEINQRQVDLAVIPGDLLISGVLGGERVAPEAVAAVLGQLNPRGARLAVLGNHDRDLGRGPAMIAALEAAGIPVLENKAVQVTPGLWVAGFSDLWTATPRPRHAIAQVPEGAALIGLTHNPDVFPDIPARVGLVIAGHTHGGQVRLPMLGARYVPSRYGLRYLRGLITEHGHSIYVSAGVGTSILPARFLVPPEIPILTLTSTAAPQNGVPRQAMAAPSLP